MSDSKGRLQKEFEKLIILLKKLKEKNVNMDFLPEEERVVLKNLDFVINNFENMDIQISSELTGEMVESFIHMIHHLREQLMEELGEEGIFLEDDDYGNIIEDIDDFQNIEKSLPVPTIDDMMNGIDPEIPMKHRLMMAIQQVDQQLSLNSDPNKMDELLDRRIELQEQLRKYS